MFFFFFSSRRRHTRFSRDWSSDVCSSDLGGKRDYGIDLAVVQTIAGQVKRVHEMGVQIALVVGGGNIFRGLAASERGFDRATGDYMGMLATVINALALQDALERTGIPARTMT